MGETFQRSALFAVVIAALAGCAGDPPAPPAARVILLGIDGADWQVIDRLVAEGRLPGFAQALEEGARGPLESVEPIFSPVVWASIATGQLPEKHGVTSFTVERDGARVPVTSDLVRSSRIWEALSDRGRTVGVVGWWTTWPAAPVNGFLVTERAWPLRFGDDGWPIGVGDEVPELPARTFPDALAERVDSLLVRREMLTPERHPHVNVTGALATINEQGPSTADMYAKDLTFLRVTEALYPATRPDFFSVYLELPDVMAHYFWEHWRFYRYARYGEPTRFTRPPGGDAASAEAVGRNFEGSYVLADAALGRLLEMADDSTLVLVVSDHGYGENETGEPLHVGDDRYANNAHWHRPKGILLAWGYGVVAGREIEGARVVDVAPTILYALGEPVARDMDGSVLTSLFTRSQRARRREVIDTYGPGGGRTVASSADSAHIQLLRSLGYVD